MLIKSFTMKINYLIISVIVLVIASHTLQAQSVSAGADIVSPISLTENTALHFGSMFAGVSGGTCVLSASGVRTQTGTVVLVNVGTTPQNATYNVGGKENATYSISLPTSFKVNFMSNSMTVSSIKAFPTSVGTTESLTGTLNASGVDFFGVGGTLNIDPEQVVGAYTGSFTVTVAYN